jgi:hypothetical protein
MSPVIAAVKIAVLFISFSFVFGIFSCHFIPLFFGLTYLLFSFIIKGRVYFSTGKKIHFAVIGRKDAVLITSCLSITNLSTNAATSFLLVLLSKELF